MSLRLASIVALSSLAVVSALAPAGPLRTATQADDARPDPRDPSNWTEWLLPVRDSVGRSPQPQGAPCRLFVRQVGEGATVVFLHGGWGGDMGDLFHGLLPLASEFRLTFYDQRGSLRSRCDELPTAADHVDDLEALRLALGEDRLVIVGHSMGTWLAMRYAERHPDRVAGLALVAPVWPTEDPPQVDAAPRWERPEVAAELSRHGLELPRRPADGPIGWSTNHRIIFAAVNLHDVTKWREIRPPWNYAPDAAASAARSMPESYDFRPSLDALPAPVVVVQGDDDFLPPATWTAGLDGVERIVVRNAGHLPYIDAPDDVHTALRAFAERTVTRR